jgi:dTDP-4-dehydrorhamnose 3,5-epimerase
MKIEHRRVDFKDSRGTIRDILKDRTVDNVTEIVTAKGTVRGNHYHRQALVYIYILEGSFNVFSREHEEAPVQQAHVATGDLVIFLPYDLHALVALEDSRFLLLASGPRGGEHTVAEVLYEVPA